MSRVAKQPIEIPAGVEVSLEGRSVTVKGKKGSLQHQLHPAVEVRRQDNVLSLAPLDGISGSDAQTGTARALVSNMVKGVSEGFERKLALVGVGYRAQAKGQVLQLTLGYSHPIDYQLPEGITAETPTPTEIVVKGIDKQKVGQAAAVIRGYRPPEPYKGKGVRYADELVVRKEAKKK
ncbi:MAG: 50S ribosomal protein L6 [Gammaproteobacteria bacterium]|nr:50S ribosomal protein L6 [Gammaproteobacteria bacterium]MDJ0871748.1 50S ribosomal protein L6 [Gammaproteobacteria bacterium]